MPPITWCAAYSEDDLTVGANIDKRCVILGGCGFLGSVVARRLLANGWQIRVFDKDGVDTWRLHGVLPHLELCTGDFMNAGDLSRAIEGMPTVLHFVGTTIPQSSMNDIPFDIETNLLPTVRLLELMRTRHAQRLVFASSGGTVYGVAARRRPLLESDPTEPISSYGVSKLAIEKYIQLFSYNYGLPYVILRLANPYGESQSVGRPQGAVGVFLHKALHGEEISIWGDGSVVRDFIYETDVANAVETTLGTDIPSGVYNIGSGVGSSLNQILETIRNTCSVTCKVSYDPSRTFDVPYNVLDIGKIGRAAGWCPEFSLADGLRRMLSALV